MVFNNTFYFFKIGKMPLFKARDIYRCKRKAVAASGYNEFVIGGERFASVYCQIFPYSIVACLWILINNIHCIAVALYILMV
jgi:cystathionine beta-lyase family protein involved in aluminum resistance